MKKKQHRQKEKTHANLNRIDILAPHWYLLSTTFSDENGMVSVSCSKTAQTFTFC